MGRSKKKQQLQPQVINIEELEIENKIEIDYDKLADAIMKAQENVAATAKNKKRYTLGTFATPLIIAFYGLSILGWFFVVAVPIGVYNSWNTFQWSNVTECISSITILLLMLGIEATVALYSILLWKSAKEVEAETDRNYIISMFSGVVSFAALIVALVALAKG